MACRARLLLVDDHPELLEALERLLGSYFSVTCAENGAEALALVQREHFDVILLDVMMPVMDGITALAAMRQAHVRTPVLLGSALPNLAALGRSMGVPCIAKPYDLKELIASLVQLARRDDQALTPGEPECASWPAPS